MPKMTNERRMQQALRIIQAWSIVAAEKAVGNWTCQEFLDISKLATKTLKECDEHNAKQRQKGTTRHKQE